MTDKPLALRLADLIASDYGTDNINDQAAAELRRLHELNEELLAREKRWSDIADVEVARCDKLQAINAQLLEALETCGEDEWYTDDDFGMVQTYDEEKVRAAIAAAKGEA